MPEFKVYRYEQRVGGRTVERLTFDPSGGFPEFGTITGPPGSTLYSPRGRPGVLLKVPKTPTNPHESYLYAARDAVRGAASGELDLAWMPAQRQLTETVP